MLDTARESSSDLQWKFRPHGLESGQELVADMPSAALPDDLAPDAPVAVAIAPSGVFALPGERA